MRPLVLALMLALPSACSPNPNQLVKAEKTEPTQHAPAPLGPAARWLCEDGRTLTVTFYAEPDRVDLAFPDGSHRTLPQAVSASGALYEADALRFHAKGDEAIFVEGEHATNCKESPAE